MTAHVDIAATRRDALAFMHKGRLGRFEQGRFEVGAREGRGLLLYGPYWRLAEGVWRLRAEVAMRPRGAPSRAGLGVEIVADNRRLAAARDFAPDDEVALTFAVSAEQSEAGHGAKFEFRLLALGGADLTISGFWLERAPGCAAEPSRWALLPRLRPTPLARIASDGAWRPRLPLARGGFAGAMSPPPRLPGGAYALTLKGEGKGGKPALEARVRLGGTILLREAVRGEALARGARLLFRAPEALGLESGEAHRLELALVQRGGGFALRSVELAPAPEDVAAPAIARGSAVVVVIGNCQAEALAQSFARGIGGDRLRVKYHFMGLNPLYLDEARRDLRECDVALMQGIGECEAYPLRADIPARAEIVQFPCLRLASLWPFDSYNGPQDHVALNLEGDSRAFAYLDWRLAQLRETAPEPEARFRAYAQLGASELRLVRRLAAFEAKRLAAMDREYDTDIGAYIEGRYRARRLFHTTTHPGPALMRKLRDWALRRLGRARPLALDRQLDLLNEWQVPVHPEVGRALGADFADERAIYHAPGGSRTWEAHVRAYIARYG